MHDYFLLKRKYCRLPLEEKGKGKLYIDRRLSDCYRYGYIRVKIKVAATRRFENAKIRQDGNTSGEGSVPRDVQDGSGRVSFVSNSCFNQKMKRNQSP